MRYVEITEFLGGSCYAIPREMGSSRRRFLKDSSDDLVRSLSGKEVTIWVRDGILVYKDAHGLHLAPRGLFLDTKNPLLKGRIIVPIHLDYAEYLETLREEVWHPRRGERKQAELNSGLKLLYTAGLNDMGIGQRRVPLLEKIAGPLVTKLVYEDQKYSRFIGGLIDKLPKKFSIFVSEI
ncbi:hypothetical protein A2631_03350 [Candidatus Daviesbacteria bacterium RIFCSPHIGHO2_01_FULL_44_29]|uniref:Uncharacterized protein n=1 Tax=Candidatus Daviesbacteria bacterium RIFCSPHIGHO2_02_FULL_43_12 TaxID=1797776 RepID=A0A1F5KKG0_9BACT|nr:MAG: hypothetical protein A2631_03350 [Candidatus Daviesbacteria bacterium RIFCSPHIGHO2_01_FULL_44_29]OGE41418.1 MAG: hypothetical protein A3D25_02745 [Candidatus Daviesbacteria bacterium RIFCSPHIGHO2_02_FULL_43_12]OGE69618.1 MAG: hypothetical protein A3B55_04490 [Candidatus Daviesbacteria bacterium RIFCSPLOWO2_01_FULL_43_15]